MQVKREEQKQLVLCSCLYKMAWMNICSLLFSTIVIWGGKGAFLGEEKFHFPYEQVRQEMRINVFAEILSEICLTKMKKKIHSNSTIPMLFEIEWSGIMMFSQGLWLSNSDHESVYSFHPFYQKSKYTGFSQHYSLCSYFIWMTFIHSAGEEHSSREEARYACWQGLKKQLWSNRARRNGSGGSPLHAVPSRPETQDVRSDANARRWWTRREMGSLSESWS